MSPIVTPTPEELRAPEGRSNGFNLELLATAMAYSLPNHWVTKPLKNKREPKKISTGGWPIISISNVNPTFYRLGAFPTEGNTDLLYLDEVSEDFAQRISLWGYNVRHQSSKIFSGEEELAFPVIRLDIGYQKQIGGIRVGDPKTNTMRRLEGDPEHIRPLTYIYFVPSHDVKIDRVWNSCTDSYDGNLETMTIPFEETANIGFRK